MNNNTSRLIPVTLIILLVAACAMPKPLPDWAVGRVQESQGEPQVLRLNQYLQLGPLTPVEAQDVLFTRADERLKLAFPDRVEVHLGEASQLGIHQYDAVGQKFSLGYGVALFKMRGSRKQGEPSLEVTTSAGVIRLREGGVMVGELDNEGNVSVLLVEDGRAEIVNNFGQAVLLENGALSQLSFALAPSAPVVAPADRVAEVLSLIQVTSQ